MGQLGAEVRGRSALVNVIWRLVLLGLLGGALLTVGLLRQTPSFLPEVSPQLLSSNDIGLDHSDDSPKISGRAAAELAASKSGGHFALAASLGHMKRAFPPIDGLVWVVSVDPRAAKSTGGGLRLPGDPPRRRIVTDSYLMVIDAETGSFLFGTARSHLAE